MAPPFIKNSFVSGEISSELWGRTDLAKFQMGASTMRNLYVNYRGGANSRPGTLFCGYSKQTGQPYPPRLVPFQFSVTQGLMLEFGDYYMRVISNGAYVTAAGANITGITQASPAVVSFSSTSAETATSTNTNVISSYAPGDQITIAGGTVITPAVIAVDTTEVQTLALNTLGTGYAPGNAIDLTGGTNSAMPAVDVLTTQVAALPVIVAAGADGTPGPATITGTTGAGTLFQANVTIGPGGGITAINSLMLAGSYTANPTNPADEPVTGGGLTGATVSLSMGVDTFSLTAAGDFQANPVSNLLTQYSSTGSGTGAVFQAIFAPLTLSIVTPGSYINFPPNPVMQASTTGQGIGATFDFTSEQAAPYANGEWVYISGVNGMTQLNGRTFVIGNVTADSFEIYDVFGNPINTTGYTPYQNGGTSAAIYTLTTPYAAEDLAWLKFTQSADEVSFAIWNQNTLTEYPPCDLVRYADNNWTIAPISIGSTIGIPATLKVQENVGYGGLGYYITYYYVTAVDGATGEEGMPIQAYGINGYLGEATPSGDSSNSDYLVWAAVEGASYYNIYAETSVPQMTNTPTVCPPPTWIAGFIGQSSGTSFSNSGISPDFNQGPPQHINPFSNGAIVSANLVTGGTAYGSNGADPINSKATVTSTTGTGALIFPIIVSNGGFPIGSLYVYDAGEDYETGDTVAITGTGTGATATLTIGPKSGQYPGSVAYFQERRVYANTQNNTDTYFFSTNGLYLNFDTHFPTVATDSITGSPWAQLVDGIQWMINMPGGLVVLTGTSAWQLTGAGGSSLNPVAITPASQQAQPQAYNGCSPIVPPIKIDYQILYVQAKGSIVREFSYQFYTNIYTGLDLTEISSQLFEGYTISQWAYAEEPRKIIWAIRNDGAMLSLTYLKPEEVSAWSRHDTQGEFVSVATCTELPVDAVYVAVQRVINGQTCYMIERMDNRQWPTIESSWCVDAGLALGQTEPEATISASSSYGAGALTGVTNLVGGKGYSSGTYAVIQDENGQGAGSGAVTAVTIVGGIITAVEFTSQGRQYAYPSIEFFDPAGSAGGSGASATVVLNNTATFTTSAAVFSAASVGDVIRMGGGIVEITGYTSPEQVTGNILVPMTATYPNASVTGAPPVVIPQVAGTWTMSTPQTIIGGLYHLVGATVTGLADGNIITPQVVNAEGEIILPVPASAVTVGLGFACQLQNVYWDAQGAVSQGRRKSVVAATVRATLSRDLMIGSNQPDGSALSPQQLHVYWGNMKPVPNRRLKTYNGLAAPLFTGDTRVPVGGGMDARGQLAIQQIYPVPMNIDAIITEVLEGDYEAGDKGGEQPAGGGSSGSAGTGFYIQPIAA